MDLKGYDQRLIRLAESQVIDAIEEYDRVAKSFQNDKPEVFQNVYQWVRRVQKKLNEYSRQLEE